jgi:mono/diheme cytochrome c family protein
MDLQPKDPEAATEGKGLYMQNRRTLEFFLIAGFLGLAIPVAILLGVRSGERTAKIAFPNGKPEITEQAAVPVNFKDVVLGSKEAEEKGQALFQANCVACHGTLADGKGPAAMALKPPPRNFLDSAEKWTKGRELSVIFKTVSEGSAGTAMAGFATALSVQERWAIVHYLATLSGLKGQFTPIDEATAAAWRPEQ